MQAETKTANYNLRGGKKMNKKMKTLLGLSLVGTLLAGCGGNESSSNSTSSTKNEDGKYSDVKLVYWSNWDSTEPQGIVIKEAVQAFENETGATVDLQFKGRKGIKEGLIPALDANQQIDMFDGAANKSNYGERIISLEQLVKDNEYEKDTNPIMMELMRSYHDGDLKEVPYQEKANGYLYNKKLFQEAGINEVPETIEELVEVAKKLKGKDIIPMTTDDAYAMQAFGMHLGRLIGNDEVKDVVDNGKWDRPEVLQTAEFFESLAKEGLFSDKVGSNVWPTGQNTEFATGKAAMYATGTFVPNEVKPITGEEFEWGFFNYPEVPDGVNGLETMVIGSQSFAITSVAENEEAAFELIETLTRGEWDEKISKESLGIPTDINNTEWPKQLEDVKPYLDNATGIFSISAGLENNPDITPALKENLLNLYAGSISGEEFVNNMKKAANN